MDVSRKHGPFDTRWARAQTEGMRAVPLDASSQAAAAVGLDWTAFSARYFPDRRRHDEEARSSYAAYRQGREWPLPPRRLRLVPSEPGSAPVEHEQGEAGTRRLLAAVAARRLEQRT